VSHLIYWPQVAGPVAASSALINDPYFASVVQLAHMNGTSGQPASPITNSCPRGNTITNVNGCVFSNTQVKFGSTSFRASVINQGAQAASHADYNFGTSEYTIEFWLWLDSLANDFNSVKIFYDSRPSGLGATVAPIIYSNSGSGNLLVDVNNTVRITGANGSIAATTWQFIALSRKAGTTRLSVNGAQVGSDFTDSLTYVQSGFHIMTAGNTGGTTKGYMDDLRITNGVGRYGSGTFSPPTSAFPNQ